MQIFNETSPVIISSSLNLVFQNWHSILHPYFQTQAMGARSKLLYVYLHTIWTGVNFNLTVHMLEDPALTHGKETVLISFWQALLDSYEENYLLQITS